jgi:fumarate reductase subunit D
VSILFILVTSPDLKGSFKVLSRPVEMLLLLGQLFPLGFSPRRADSVRTKSLLVISYLGVVLERRVTSLYTKGHARLGHKHYIFEEVKAVVHPHVRQPPR